ncbi:MAG: 6-bladed beta-propeller [Proteiniphilum sp.]|jgi:hypothetical protein|nr:6-bladed beta-propeller [Proteiniphilum sp.]
MRIIIYLLFVFGFVFSCCTRSIQEQTPIPLIAVNIDRMETLELSDFFADITYVPLADSFLVSTIERAKIYEDKLFLLTNESVLVFDVNSGRCLSRVKHLGGSPDECISLYDMLYDKNENVIELLDEQKVLRYGFDGHFISEFKTSFTSFSFHKITPSTYIFYNNNMISDHTDCNLVRYDANALKITASYFPIDKHLASYFFTTNTSSFSSETNPSFHFCPSDTIYGFTDDYEPYAKYVLDFGKHHTPSRFYEEDYSDILDFSTKAVRQEYIYLFGNFYENNYMAALFIRNDKNVYWALYDKNKQTVHAIDRWRDDHHSRTFIPLTYGNGPFIMDETYLYFFLQPDQLIDLMENENRSALQENQLDTLYHSPVFSEQSNPIIVKCKFKNL